LQDGRPITRFLFDRDQEDPAIGPALAAADVLLVSVPPDVSADPVLAKFGRRLAALPQDLKIIYLSTIGVYGDRQGEWVDEERMPTPKSDRSTARMHAEKSWMTLARDANKTVHILRLAGIYGPERNALEALRRGTAHRIVKKGQVFNRIHVADISAAIAALLQYDGGSDVWNLSDDEPAPPQDVVTYAASLMQIEPPPEQDIEVAALSPLGHTFYAENKRAANRKLKQQLGVTLAYPTYREGLAALWEAGEGRT
jgi:nucleoside-diphosphate-sugar epimerase